MYDKFDKDNIPYMRKAIEAALEPLGARFGMEFKIDGSVSYTDFHFTAKVLCTIGDMEIKEREDFERICSKYRFDKSDYGKTFTYKGVVYKLIGFKPSARTYPCLVSHLDENMQEVRTRFKVDFIKKQLGVATS